MATVIRRYKLTGVSNAVLASKVAKGTRIAAVYCTPAFDVEVDDSTKGVIEALDEFMASQGFTYDAKALTSPHVVSPDGKTHELVVDDAGNLSTKDIQ
jgi:hypothetical protein